MAVIAAILAAEIQLPSVGTTGKVSTKLVQYVQKRQT